MVEPVATNGAAAPEPSGSVADQEPTLAEKYAQLSEQFKEFKEDARSRLSDMGKQLARIKQSEAAAATISTQQSHVTQSPPSVMTQADMMAAIALDRLMQGLPEHLQQRLAEYGAAGATPSAMLREAQTMHMVLGADATSAEQGDAGKQSQSRTRDRPGKAPPRTAVQHPRTLSQYYELARSNPEQKKQLDKDPTFHPEDLPHRE